MKHFRRYTDHIILHETHTAGRYEPSEVRAILDPFSTFSAKFSVFSSWSGYGKIKETRKAFFLIYTLEIVAFSQHKLSKSHGSKWTRSQFGDFLRKHSRQETISLALATKMVTAWSTSAPLRCQGTYVYTSFFDLSLTNDNLTRVNPTSIPF